MCNASGSRAVTIFSCSLANVPADLRLTAETSLGELTQVWRWRTGTAVCLVHRDETVIFLRRGGGRSGDITRHTHYAGISGLLSGLGLADVVRVGRRRPARRIGPHAEPDTREAYLYTLMRAARARGRRMRMVRCQRQR
jgi:hypothetical protein